MHGEELRAPNAKKAEEAAAQLETAAESAEAPVEAGEAL